MDNNKNKDVEEKEKAKVYVCLRDFPVTDAKGKVKIAKKGSVYASKSQTALDYMVSQNKIGLK